MKPDAGEATARGLPTLAYVVNSLNAGGTERLVVEMGCDFAREFNVHVYCLDEPGVWAAELRGRGIPVHCLWRQPGLDLSVAAGLASSFRREQVALVHAHQCTPWFYAALSRLMYSTPRLLLEEHGRFYPEVENKKRVLLNQMLIRRLTHRFVAVSQDIRARLAQYEGLDARRIEVIYNGVPPIQVMDDADRTALRASLGFGPDDFVIGAVGRFDTIKNLPMLVRSLEEVCSRAPHARGLLVGDGPVFQDIDERIAASGLVGRVVLTGFRSDARRLMQCLDLYVLCSFSEGTSMALLEAMSVGVPAAVTAVGGNPEIVRAQETGWVVPSDDPAALATAIMGAVRDPALRRRFAQAARQRFEQQFSSVQMLSQYRRIYAEMLAGTAQPLPVCNRGA